MSVTFWFPDAPTKVVNPYPEEPDYEEIVPLAPFFEINLSNSNAAAFLNLIDPTANWDELCGEWSPEDIAHILPRVIYLLNVSPEQLVSEDVVQKNFISFGRTPDYVRDRLMAFMQMFQLAQQLKTKIVFG